MVRRCWVIFQCLRRPTILITVGQGPTTFAVDAGGVCLDIFTLIYPFSSLSPSLWETARYRLKYCLQGPLNPKQPTNQPTHRFAVSQFSILNYIYKISYLSQFKSEFPDISAIFLLHKNL